MGKLVHRSKCGEFVVIQEQYRKKGHVLINTKGEYEAHSHIKKLGTCKMLIQLIKDEIVPDSDYLRKSVLRVSLDDKYIAKVKRKIEKDKNKTWYHNPMKGVSNKKTFNRRAMNRGISF